MYLNVAVLLGCLVVILVFKNIAADRAADFMEEIAGDEGSGDGYDDTAMTERAVDFCGIRIHQALDSAIDSATQGSQSPSEPATPPETDETQDPVPGL